MRFTCMLSLFCRVWVFETPMDCSPPGSSVHGILQARILEWVAIPSCRGSFWPRHHTCIFYISCIGRWVFTTSTTWEALGSISPTLTANRGTKRWLPSRIGTLMGNDFWALSVSAALTRNEARWVTSPTRAPGPTSDTEKSLCTSRHNLTGSRAEREEIQALGRVQTTLHPEAGGQQPCDPLRDRRWRRRGAPPGEMKGSEAVRAGGPWGSHLPCSLCSQGVKFTVERLGGAEKERWGGKAMTTWKSKSGYNMLGLKWRESKDKAHTN